MSEPGLTGLRDQMVAVVREDTEFAVAIDAEFTEAEYVVDHLIEWLTEQGYVLVPRDLAQRTLAGMDLALSPAEWGLKIISDEDRAAWRSLIDGN